MARARVELLEWIAAGTILDPKGSGRVIMRLFFSTKHRRWAYRAYTGASERNVTYEHCLNQAQALIGIEHHVGKNKYVGRLNWKAPDQKEDYVY